MKIIFESHLNFFKWYFSIREYVICLNEVARLFIEMRIFAYRVFLFLNNLSEYFTLILSSEYSHPLWRMD